MANREYHIKFGVHSNIPACCINFFVNKWDKREMWRQHDNPIVKKVRASGANYVQCPKCLSAGRKVQIKLCDAECGGDHTEDFE
jgi:hypothetical protein